MTHTEQRAKLAQLKAVCDAATAGPWKALWVVHGMPAKPCKFGLVAEETGLETGRMWEREDAVFMEQAANELPALIEAHEKALDEIERLRAENRQLSKQYVDLCRQASEEDFKSRNAAAEIGYEMEQLRAEIERLRAAGKVLAGHLRECEGDYHARIGDEHRAACREFEEGE